MAFPQFSPKTPHGYFEALCHGAAQSGVVVGVSERRCWQAERLCGTNKDRSAWWGQGGLPARRSGREKHNAKATADTVSYTHLDVYKRQAWVGSRSRGSARAWRSIANASPATARTPSNRWTTPRTASGRGRWKKRARRSSNASAPATLSLIHIFARRGEHASYGEEASAYLSAVAADIVFPGGLMALREEGFDDIRAVLDYAIVSEKDSILFYLELARLSNDEAARNVFLSIAEQERGHMRRLCRQRAEL